LLKPSAATAWFWYTYLSTHVEAAGATVDQLHFGFWHLFGDAAFFKAWTIHSHEFVFTSNFSYIHV
jgi:hypothetical protein